MKRSGAPGEEALRIRRLVKEVADAEGFPLFELTFGEDSTGTAAVWISFFLEHEYPTNEDSIQVLTRLRNNVKSNLFSHDISRVAYVRFRDRPAAAD